MRQGTEEIIRVATCNVNTLNPRQHVHRSAQVSGEILVGKVQSLEIQFNNACLDFIGIQEGRARESSFITGTFYDMITTAATDRGTVRSPVLGSPLCRVCCAAHYTEKSTLDGCFW